MATFTFTIAHTKVLSEPCENVTIHTARQLEFLLMTFR
jgi:hypothetical protein